LSYAIGAVDSNAVAVPPLNKMHARALSFTRVYTVSR
jgi:hypothetical protein